ncbi:unnamed protein product [Meloidogyne enterolobii]|uniref:Uncharacterized protein n=1 Tax=Meloidogyne enterolobii TaxID=390850 RepID=A0ACB1AKW1_MELEN
MDPVPDKISVPVKPFYLAIKEAVPQFPQVKRVIWFVRHGERLDNDKDLKNEVKNTPGQQYEYKGRIYNFDNSPLNETGEERAKVLNNV